MPEYLSPGVYVEEVDRGPKPIEGVGTAMAAFVGIHRKGRLPTGDGWRDRHRGSAQQAATCHQLDPVCPAFGGFVGGAYLPHAVYGYFHNGGSRCYVVSVKTIGCAQAALLGSDGKPYLLVRAKEAGYDGLRLRVKVDVPQLSAAKTKAAKPKGKEEEGKEAEAAPADDSGLPPFTVTVERQAPSGAWLAKETVPESHAGRVEGRWRQKGRDCLSEQPGAGAD